MSGCLRLIVSLGGLLMTLPAPAQALPGWNLVWSDEFSQADNSGPDPVNWGYDIGGGGWGNNELQYYTNRTQNARIEAGHLVIEAREENFGGRAYTSARLLTKNKASWTYGRIEARIKIPRGKGIWPAFWMLGTNIDAVGWPNCGEIDIMENIGSLPSNLYGTLHGPGYSGGDGISGTYVLPGGAALADDFHVFAIEREENRIRWFIDGQQYFTLTPANLPAGKAWVFNAPQFLILNVAVGGNWPGNPDGSTVFPQRMIVDYVRVYEADLGGGPNGNLLANPGFESGSPAGWTTFGPNVYVETSASHSGSRAVKVFGQFTGSANESGAFQQFPSAAGDAYAADAWLFTPAADKIAGANAAWVEVSFRNSGGTVLSLHRSATMTSASTASVWQKLLVNRKIDPLTGEITSTNTQLVAPPGTAFVRKRIVFHQAAMAAGAVWFDDLNLSKITVVPPDPFDSWIAGFDFSAIPDADLTPAGDPDGDGASNLMEFALNGNPASPAITNKLRSRMEEVSSEPLLVLTLPVREGAVFGGSPAKSAVVGALQYTIEGTTDLNAFDQGVIEIPARADGMPELDAGWTYRSFTLDGAASKGFLRARIASP
jgi:beta-glucanase (GH16 family)